jgi:hypothetical protein
MAAMNSKVSWPAGGYLPTEKEIKVKCGKCEVGDFAIRITGVLLQAGFSSDQSGVSVGFSDISAEAWAQPRGVIWQARALEGRLPETHRLQICCGHCDWTGTFYVAAASLLELRLVHAAGSFVIR